MTDPLKDFLSTDFSNSGIDNNKEDYSYVNLSGVDLLTNNDAIKDVRDYYAAQGETFSNYSEMWDKFYSDRRWADVNTVGAGSALVESTMAGDDRDRLARLSRIWANAPMRGTTLDRVWEYGKAAVLDPTNLIPVAGQAAKAKAVYTTARAAGKTLQQSKNAARIAGAKQAGKQEAIIGGAVGGGQDLMKQATEVQQGLSEGVDLGRVATSAALDAGLSGAAGFGLDLGGTSQIGQAIPGINKVLGGDYAENLPDWNKSTTLGQNLLQRQQVTDRELERLRVKRDEEGIDEVDKQDLDEIIAAKEAEIDSIEATRQQVDDINSEMDDLAKQIQDGQKAGTDVSKMRKQFNRKSAEFNRITSKTRIRTRKPVEAEAEEPLVLTDDMRQKMITKQETPLLEGERQRTVADDEVIQLPGETSGKGTEGNPADENTNVDAAPEPAPEVQLSTPRLQARLDKILASNPDTLDMARVNQLAADGKLKLTSKQKLGADALSDLEKIVATERAADPVAETVKETGEDVVEATETVAEATKAEVDDEAIAESVEYAPSVTPDLEDEADVLVPQMMKEVAGLSGDRIVNARTKVLPALEASPAVKRIIRQRLNNLELSQAKKAGAVKPEEAASGRSIKRSSDRTQVSMDRMEDVPPYIPDPDTGRLIKNPEFTESDTPVSSAIRMGQRSGDQVVTNKAGLRKQEFAKTTAIRMAEVDAKKGVGKLFYPYVSYRGDVLSDGKSSDGLTAYYVPHIGKSFKDIDTVLKAMETQGIKVNEEFVVYDDDMVPIFTDAQYAAEKNKILESFKAKKITADEKKAKLAQLDERAGAAMDEPQKKEVIGRDGKIIKRLRAGIPQQRNGKIIAAIPRKKFDENGELIPARMLTPGQIKRGSSAEKLLGGSQDANNWYIGYVPKNMRDQTSDIEAMIEDFDPLDASNKVGDIDTQNPTMPPAPKDLESQGDRLVIDTNSLKESEVNTLYMAYSLARNRNINLIGDLKVPADIHQHQVTLRDLTRLEQMIDLAPWEVSYNIGGKTIPMSNGTRLKMLDTIHGLVDSIAPNGIRKPTVDIETSLQQLDTIYQGASPTTRNNMEKLIRLVAPDEVAPIFETADMDADVLGRFVNDRNDALNRVQINADMIGKTADTVGLSETHIVAHELGHWVYSNLMTNADKKQFWRAISGYYDGDGRLFKGGEQDAMMRIRTRSPYFKGADGREVGFKNALDNPAEYFANQFSLYMGQKYDLMMWPNQTFWNKFMALTKKLWFLMSNKTVVDPDLEPIFDTIIKRKDLQLQKQFMRPKEPTNKYANVLFANYDNLRVSMNEIARALQSADYATFIEAIKKPDSGLEATLKRLTTREGEAKKFAAKRGEDFRGYTGMLQVIKEYGTGNKLRGALTYLEGIGENTTDKISKIKPKLQGAGTDIEIVPLQDFQDIYNAYESKIVPALTDAMDQINRAYERLTGGDIPTRVLHPLEVEQRSRTGMQKIEQSQTLKQNTKEASRRRNLNQSYIDQAVKLVKSKKTPDVEEDFAGFASSEFPDIAPLMVEFGVEARKAGKKGEAFTGKTKKLAMAIASKYATKLKVTKPATVVKEGKGGYIEGPYQNATGAQLGVLLREALIGTGDKKKLQDVAWEFSRPRGKAKQAIIPDSQAVINALKVESAFELGGERLVGIGENTPIVIDDFLEKITARTPEKSHAARKVAMRVLALGHKIAPSTKTEEFTEFRNFARKMSANLGTNDITQTVREITKLLYSTKVLSDSTRNLLEKTAIRFGYDADSILQELVIEDVDMTANRTLMQDIKETLGDVDNNDIEDAINEARNDMRDAVAYTVNGLISDEGARERFLPLALYGDMKSGEASISRGSPASYYSKDVPAEFAVEYANETMGRFSQASVDAIKDYTGGNTDIFFLTPNKRGILGDTPTITDRPVNNLRSTGEQIIESAPLARRTVVADLVDQSRAMRESVNNMRQDGSNNDMLDHYTFVDVVGERLEQFGATDFSKVTPVFIKDSKPAIFPQKMTFKEGVVRGISEAIKRNAKSADIAAQVDKLVSQKGVFTGREVFNNLTSLAGGTDKMKRLLRQYGYSTLTVDGQQSVLSDKFYKQINSPDLVKARPLLGEAHAPSGVNNYIISEARIASDGGEQATKIAAAELEKAGVSKKALKGITNLRNKTSKKGEGRPVKEKDIEEIREAIHVTTRTQSDTIRRSGMNELAEFAEPSDGSGGHYERVHARMAKVLQPMTRLLNELPDSKNSLSRWFDAGLRQMYDTTAEAAARLMGDTDGSKFAFNPVRREQQPESHRRIGQALRYENDARFLKPSERKVYNLIRGYLDDIRGRLSSSGMMVGNIAENYFPQVWRTDLIQARRTEFESILTDYLMTEEAARTGSRPANKEDFAKRARRITTQMVDDDAGVNLPDSQVFNGDTKNGFLKQRMLRLDMFPEFRDATNPKRDLSKFLENDLMMVMSKYSEGVERKLDIVEKFGPNAHGYRDYLSMISGRTDAMVRLLTGNKILKSDYHILADPNDSDLPGAAVYQATANSSLFKAPFSSRRKALLFTEQLVRKAQGGVKKDELTQDIMAKLAPTEDSDEFSDQMRANFLKRAQAMGAALEDTRGFTKFPSRENVRHAEGFLDLLMNKAQGSESWRKTTSTLRMINGVTLLSFTTLTSLGDLVLPLIRSGDFKAWSTALANFTRDPVSGSAYRDMIRNVGVAVENTVHQRMTNSYGVDANRFTTGFFTATGLTPWTDMMREIAGATAYEHFKAQARIAIEAPNTKQGRLAKRALETYGLQQFGEKGAPSIDIIMRSGGTQAEHALYENVQTAMIKFANETIFAPNKNDLPQWATTPTGQLVFQLKSFPLKMLRLGRYAINEAKKSPDGDRNLAPLLYYMTAGPAMGFTAANVKDVVQMRGGEDNREAERRERRLSKTITSLEGKLGENADKALGWYFDGFMTMGGLGIIGEMLYDTVAQADNGAYGQVRVGETFFGPSFGLGMDALTITGGGFSAIGDAISGEGTNGKERAAMREIISRIPVAGQMGGVRESVVDLIAGEKGARK